MEFLDRLLLEWRNADDDNMKPIREALTKLRATEGYEENLAAVALQEEERRADNPRFIARLLYMLAERPISIIQLQRVSGIHEGHLYRFLERAGVDYKAITVRKLEVEEDHRPWKAPVYADPLSGTLIRGGEIVKADMHLMADDDRALTVTFDDDADLGPAPLPTWPKIRLRRPQ